MFDAYKDYTDEQLIDRLRDGEDQVTDYLMDKYKNLVRSKAKTMYILGGDNDDLIQEGMIGLLKAIRGYDCGRDASFYTFAELCISRQIYTAVQSSGRQKHAPLNTYISLYANMAEDGDTSEDAKLVDALASDKERNPEDVFIDRENVEKLQEIIDAELSDFEKQVLELYLTGIGYIQVAKILGRDEKATDNALQRIKMKIRKAMLKKGESR